MCNFLKRIWRAYEDGDMAFVEKATKIATGTLRKSIINAFGGIDFFKVNKT